MFDRGAEKATLSVAQYNMQTDRIMRIFKEPIAILGTFIALKAFATIFSFTNHAPSYMSQIRLAEFVVLALFSFYVIRGRIFALWATGIYLVIHVFAVFLAIFIIPIDHYVLKIVVAVLGLYFFFGGLVLIRIARETVRRTG